MTPPFVVARHDCAEAVPDTKNFPRLTPLTIRGARGVMEITPFIPLTLRGRFKGRSSTLRGDLGEEVVFGIQASKFQLSFVIWA